MAGPTPLLLGLVSLLAFSSSERPAGYLFRWLLRPGLRGVSQKTRQTEEGFGGSDNCRGIWVAVYLISNPQALGEVRILRKERLRRGGSEPEGQVMLFCVEHSMAPQCPTALGPVPLRSLSLCCLVLGCLGATLGSLLQP